MTNPSPPDFRALCIQALEAWDSYNVDPLRYGIGELEEVMDVIRAALKTPPLAPIPVSERLPGAEDCNADGNCWWFMAAHQNGIFKQSSTWCLAKRVPEDFGIWTHWLPHWAIPLPEEE